MISSCGARGYTYTSPLPYAISSTVAPPDFSASPTIGAQSWPAQRMSADCVTTYHAQDGDTCDSISIAQSVSSRDLVEANEHLDNWCGGLSAGQELCLPAQCKLHLLTTEDSCESLLRQYESRPRTFRIGTKNSTSNVTGSVRSTQVIFASGKSQTLVLEHVNDAHLAHDFRGF